MVTRTPGTIEVRRLQRTKYEDAYEHQKALVDARIEDQVPDLLVLTEHEPVVTIGRGNPVSLAEDVADQERRRLGVGDQPVVHLRSLLEAVHRFSRKLAMNQSSIRIEFL